MLSSYKLKQIDLERIAYHTLLFILLPYMALALVMAQYYDIDDILADEELVPAVFLEAINGVGLFESNDTNRVNLN
ncbi:hypothetical protein L6452_13412 [Arctium lappa]|uniref:Uncharacterized protein n=1 Tax=Arctium lappa TaxID=4217 RepID=A0ACB9CIG6_ARCLA|nr:hypothetical protein L6452_13412 [Arctium lappa]